MRKHNIKSSKQVILAMALLFILSLLFIFSANATSARAEGLEKIEFEPKIYSNATLDEKFDDSSVIVIMDKHIGGINKIHKENFFGNFAKESIKDLTYIDGDIDNHRYLDTENFSQILQIKLPEKSKENVLNTIKKLEKIEGIKWAGPNYYERPLMQPISADGSRYSQLWGMHGEYGIKAEAAWDISTGSNDVRVGIIDSGIADHPDLNANRVNGWDFYNNNSITNDDPIGHGTHVAGIIGAQGNNSQGVTGVSWNIKLVSLRVIDEDDFGNDSWIARAIDYAASINLPIINLS